MGDSAEFGAWVREAREARGISQEKLADLAGIARGTVRNAEAGKPLLPMVKTAIALALESDPPSGCAECARLREQVNRLCDAIRHLSESLSAAIAAQQGVSRG